METLFFAAFFGAVVAVWAGATGKLVRRGTCEIAEIRHVLLSPDGGTVLAAAGFVAGSGLEGQEQAVLAAVLGRRLGAVLMIVFVACVFLFLMLRATHEFLVLPPARAGSTRRTLRTILTKPGWNHLEVRTLRGVLTAMARKVPRE